MALEAFSFQVEKYRFRGLRVSLFRRVLICALLRQPMGLGNLHFDFWRSFQTLASEGMAKKKAVEARLQDILRVARRRL